MRQIHLAPITLALVALSLNACGSGGSGTSSGSASSRSSTASAASSPAAAPADAAAGGSSRHAATVLITNFAYAPAAVTVSPGTRVTWTNHDSTAHTATSAGSFDTGTINPGGSASVVLRKPGTYRYICSFHAFMHGTVVVR